MDCVNVGLWICEVDVDFEVFDVLKEVGCVEILVDIVVNVFV